jgi:tellurite resistance protein TerC
VNVPIWVWLATVGALLALLALDLLLVDRTPHEVSIREAGLWVACYVALAALFGVGVLVLEGGGFAGQFLAGYLTEYSLSIDNLFVFVIIMAAFGVPKANQHKVLLIGILLALIFRAGFIAAGAAVLSRSQWVFFLFGAFLIYTAAKLAAHRADDTAYEDNALIRWTKRVLPVTERYDGARLLTRVGGRRMVTPLLIAMLAIGTTDLLFALDSIPAIFGLTHEPYLVFTANAFALMGLRQLYFLLGGLLERLVYLSTGLAVVLGFIGVKLVLEALHGYGVPYAPATPAWLSLTVIVGVLAVTTVASLAKPADRGQDTARPSNAAPTPGRGDVPPASAPARRLDRSRGRAASGRRRPRSRRA